MFKNYLKIAWRNLLRNKGFSLLNIIGLSIGLAVVTLIVLWINFEVSYDRFHENNDRVYQVNNQYPVDGEIWTWNSTPKIMASVIAKDYPEVENVSRYNYEDTFLFSIGDKRIKSTGSIVDPDFLKIFSFPLVEGNIETVLKDVNSVVVTQKLAEKLFGNESPIGKILKVDNADSFTVTGVLKDLPRNTTFNFEFLMPWAYLHQKGWNDDYWSNNSVATYVMLKSGTNYEIFSKKIKSLRERYDKESPEMETLLYPFERTYLYSKFENGIEVGGRIDIIRLFGIIAGIILIIACINFMNLSTARSEKRAKEVGVRKVIGAKKGALVSQFLGESILISSIAAFLAILIVWASLPSFNTLIERELSLNFTDKWFWLSAVGIVLFTGVLAGSYPALYLSSFKPVSVIKGVFKKESTLVSPRKVLVVLQFSIAIILITATIVVNQQLVNVQDRDLGYNKDKLVYIAMEGTIKEKYPLIKEALLNSGAATAVTRTVSPPTENWSNSWDIGWKGKKEDDKTLILRFTADTDIVKTLGLELVAGRDLDHIRFPTDSTAMLINETAMRHMGFEQPIGQQVEDMGRQWNVVGVVKDFILTSPFQKIEPIIIHSAGEWTNFITLKLNGEYKTAHNIASLSQIFKEYNPEYPFEYEFVDQQYAKKFNDEKQTGQLVSLFTVLTIFISCLGLFGLTSYMAENRIKEIGVRKVLGATVQSITTLLSVDFLKLVLISIVLAIPVSWYFMTKWLESFAYKVTISWWFFALAGVLALAIAFLTVSYQAIKAAIANPVKSLRTE
ncbi:ABC transporter permease [Flagellimonas pacifica]|uniref:ABC-type transport system, involved in lipoprotein release, permease component n=1 Tax=Flagellimonas pacifica TaxID=1247520 RepID=A0A285MCM9_9FLAO|nr:ABC transporter permease [Allomuricauda parva]SNY94925.1 ABC-type transport system, involved in lipoprotein release, permease component [Allomuricauda parva]